MTLMLSVKSFTGLPHSFNCLATALSTRTNEGLSLGLSVAFQYKLIQADIPKLYQLTATNYASTYLRIARQTILAIAGSYAAQDYWVIIEIMSENLTIKTVFRLTAQLSEQICLRA